MSGYATYEELTARSVDYFWFSDNRPVIRRFWHCE